MERSIHRDEEKRKAIAGAAFALAMAVVFSLIFYTCNTPLGPAVGSDNAMYLTMGTALAKGYAPYTQIFDHKGPLLFILQMIPQLFTEGYSTFSVFVQEVLFLWACLMLLARMAKKLGVSAVLVQVIYLAVYAPLTNGANLTEEYANLFTLIGLDVTLSVFGEGFDEESNLFKPACWIGAMTMLCFMLRANNMLPLCAGVGALAVYLAFVKKWKSLGACASGFLAGCAVVFIPIALWLMYHGAFGEMIYGAFMHNMMYTKTQGLSRMQKLLHDPYGYYSIFMAALTCLGGLALLIRTRRFPLAMAMAAAAAGGGLAAFLSHKFYEHYQMLAVPAAALGAAQILALIKDKKWLYRAACGAAALACAAGLLVSGQKINALREADYAAMQELTPDAIALYDQVPEEDRDRFLAYRVEPKWYVATKALPCMRFYFLQEILADADPAVMDEIVACYESEPPLWVVLFYNRPFSPPYDKRVQEILDTRYEFVDARGQYQLLKLKETP